MSNVDAENAVLCSYLGLTARDLADIGSFSERFARDLLAGRRPFPRDVQKDLLALYADLANIQQVMIEQAATEDSTIYIYRTLEQFTFLAGWEGLDQCLPRAVSSCSIQSC